MAKRKHFAGIKDTNTPTKKALRNPVERKRERREGPGPVPLAGASWTQCQEPQEASQRHLRELVTWCRDSGGQRDAVSLGSKPGPA